MPPPVPHQPSPACHCRALNSLLICRSAGACAGTRHGPGIRAFRTIRGLQERSSGPHAAMTSRIA
jgi:hypothetical protein